MRRTELRHGAVVVGPPLFTGEDLPEQVEYTVVGGLGPAQDHVVIDRDGVPYRLELSELRHFQRRSDG